VFDTQIAAAFAGYGTQVGYADLVARVLGVRVARSEALTRWDLRPLSAEQLAYARTDVVHLLALADALAGKLAGRGRLEWARQECRALEESTDERNEEVLYERLPRLGGLSGQGRAVARALVRWRDETARALDRPAGWPLPDRVLVEVAKRAPRTRGELEAIRGLPEQTLHRRHRELLAADEQGRAAEPLPQVGERVDTDPTDAPLVALAGAVLRHEAAAAGLAPELIATQADLARLVARARRGTEGPPIRTLEGWRGELVGEELLALLAGRRRVRVDPRTGLVVEPDDGAAPGGPADPSASRGGQPQAALEREDVGRRGADAAPDDG
jgi:ribonuclease D